MLTSCWWHNNHISTTASWLAAQVLTMQHVPQWGFKDKHPETKDLQSKHPKLGWPFLCCSNLPCCHFDCCSFLVSLPILLASSRCFGNLTLFLCSAWIVGCRKGMLQLTDILCCSNDCAFFGRIHGRLWEWWHRHIINSILCVGSCWWLLHGCRNGCSGSVRDCWATTTRLLVFLCDLWWIGGFFLSRVCILAVSLPGLQKLTPLKQQPSAQKSSPYPPSTLSLPSLTCWLQCWAVASCSNGTWSCDSLLSTKPEWKPQQRLVFLAAPNTLQQQLLSTNLKNKHKTMCYQLTHALENHAVCLFINSCQLALAAFSSVDECWTQDCLKSMTENPS